LTVIRVLALIMVQIDRVKLPLIMENWIKGPKAPLRCHVALIYEKHSVQEGISSVIWLDFKSVYRLYYFVYSRHLSCCLLYKLDTDLTYDWICFKLSQSHWLRTLTHSARQ
jgi:hypothetical protein